MLLKGEICRELLASPFRICVVVLSLWSALTIPIAWWSSDKLAFEHFNQQLLAVRDNNLESLQELRLQVADALTRLNVIAEAHGDLPSCTSDVFQQQAQIIRQWRYVNEAALQMSSGQVCHSFGVQHSPHVLPNDSAYHYRTMGDRYAYWFDAGAGSSADAGTVAVGQGSAYLWLNKGILLDVMRLPKDLSLELIDEQTMRILFSNGVASIDLSAHPVPEHLTLTEERMYLTYTTQWVGLVALVSLPIVLYQKMKLILFVGLLCVSLLTFLALYRSARWAYENQFSLAAQLRKALTRDELKLHYQPIVDLRSGEWKGAEALLRWSCNGKPVTPTVFIPLAEKHHMIQDITRWVCRQVAQDHATYLWACSEMYITINLSPIDVIDEGFPEFVDSLFKAYGIPASRIVFEVTESAFINPEQACFQLQCLRDMGHRIAIDDFGTGYSCLSYLKTLPIDILKIDRSFLAAETIHSTDSILWHITRLAHSLNLVLVAEGIEELEQLEVLDAAEVQLGQGWYFSRELPIEQFAQGCFRPVSTERNFNHISCR